MMSTDTKMQEIWKDIKGYEGLYQVSNTGKVKSVHYNQTSQSSIIKYEVTKKGYHRVTLLNHQKVKHVFIHRLVAEAFIPNPDGLPYINHKDEDKSNNSVDNLEWCGVTYNNRYSLAHPIKCIETGETFVGINVACEKLSVSKPCVIKALKNPDYATKGFHFKYVEK